MHLTDYNSPLAGPWLPLELPTSSLAHWGENPVSRQCSMYACMYIEDLPGKSTGGGRSDPLSHAVVPLRKKGP
eukprot:scaffold92400_cov27-Tisochrysis_lutea.AAC.1